MRPRRQPPVITYAAIIGFIVIVGVVLTSQYGRTHEHVAPAAVRDTTSAVSR